MRLHIMMDEKVINRTIAVFEEIFPTDNKFIILLRKNVAVCNHVIKIENVFFIHQDSNEFWKIVGDIKSYKHVIFHFLTSESLKYLEKIDHNSIYWIEWGADLYSGLLEQRGYKLYDDEKILWKISKLKCPYFLYKLIYNQRKEMLAKRMLLAVKKIRYFAPDSMQDEYSLLLSYYPELSHLEYRDIFYYPIDEILGSELLQAKINGKNIVLGNSSSPTGNHISVFKRLQNFHSDGKIIVPLSYGHFGYRKLVTIEGRRILGDRFCPVFDFLQLEKYNELLLSARIFIYGNWRQEAVGNILIALYLGGKVFLDRKNPLWLYYKTQGLILFDIDDLSQDHLQNGLSDNEINTNRKILLNLYSKEKMLKTISQNFQ